LHRIGQRASGAIRPDGLGAGSLTVIWCGEMVKRMALSLPAS